MCPLSVSLSQVYRLGIKQHEKESTRQALPPFCGFAASPSSRWKNQAGGRRPCTKDDASVFSRFLPTLSASPPHFVSLAYVRVFPAPLPPCLSYALRPVARGGLLDPFLAETREKTPPRNGGITK
ncbi:unnamed protein product, partial [Scytosiphon promiscuus]